MSRSAPAVSRSRTSETIEQRRQRTANARQSLAATFPTPEARREHLSRAGQIGNARRRVLSGGDVAALAEAYRTLDAIVKKHDIAGNASPEHDLERAGRDEKGDPSLRDIPSADRESDRRDVA